MFETFDSATDVQSARRFALSTVASLGVCALLGLGAVVVGSQVKEVIKEKRVDVVFRPPPPPPPPPKPKAKPPPPPPTVAAPAAMVAPKEIPVEKPPEADAANAMAAAPIAVGGTGQLVAGAIVTGVDSPGVAAGGMRRAPPINLPEAATPPKELESNVLPEFPADMRAKGQEGMVILKIVVEVDGRVGNVKVMRGEEPFVGAALAVVKTWRYEPALVDGQPTAVFRIVKVPFRLKS